MKRKIPPELIDGSHKDYKNPEDITGSGGILKLLTKASPEHALESELTHDLGSRSIGGQAPVTATVVMAVVLRH